MDLENFVSQTLSQIISGVKSAQVEAVKHGAEINPHLSANTTELGKQGFLWGNGGVAQIVQFDVALTVFEGTGTKGGIGVFAGAINIGSAGQSKNESSSVSRVKFSVPLTLPHK